MSNTVDLSSLSDDIRQEIDRIILSLSENTGDQPNPFRTHIPRYQSSTPLHTPYNNQEYIRVLETIVHEYNHNIREYNGNIRSALNIFSGILSPIRQQQPSFPGNIHDPLPHVGRSHQYYSTNHHQRYPAPPVPQNVSRQPTYTVRELHELLALPQHRLNRHQRWERSPSVMQNVIVRPTEQEISASVCRFRYSREMHLRNSRCPITLDEFQEGDALVNIIFCGHCFQEQAFDNWFQANVRCPVCRYDIREYSQSQDTNPLDTPSFINGRPSENGESGDDSDDESEMDVENAGGNTSSMANSEIITDTMLENITSDFTAILNQYMNDANIAAPTDTSNNVIYRFEIPIYIDEYYDISNNIVGV